MAAVAWAAAAFLGEVWRQQKGCAAPPAETAPVVAWRLGTPPVERLRHFLDAARETLPSGTVAAFASPDGPFNAPFFRRMWAAYLAPELNLPGAADAASPYPDYILAYGVRVDRPGASLVRPLPGGALYRTGPP
jgi:hypothetical protein